MRTCKICNTPFSRRKYKSHVSKCYNRARQFVIQDQAREEGHQSDSDQSVSEVSDASDQTEIMDTVIDDDFDYGDDCVSEIESSSNSSSSDSGSMASNETRSTASVTSEWSDEETSKQNDRSPVLLPVFYEPGQPNVYTVTDNFLLLNDKVSKRSLELYKINKQRNVSRQAHREHTEFINKIFKEEGLVSVFRLVSRDLMKRDRADFFIIHSFHKVLVAYKTEQVLLKAFPVKPRNYDVCINGCRLLMDDAESCQKCGKPRYVIRAPGSIRKPQCTMKYLSIQDQLAALLARPESRDQLRGLTSLPENDSAELEGYFDGKAWKEKHKHLFTGPHDIALCLYVDSFTPFKRTKISLTRVFIKFHSYSLASVTDYIIQSFHSYSLHQEYLLSSMDVHEDRS
ncbi:hypothetical protein BDB00DRAFT_352549 [Zychaea mexicana]|uniref:uncharacterized protein n=1 Tax=Zychaea mexicana TaxID=64656 RepID=UPI0022FDE558|nr:uncharacterized protein BDB00DRAFT_352549 [Zychaea mexicana]KAI9466384.1 hypothetical protein BDB00DRAFT_352549 [Zychaea mexicana]